MNYKQNIQKKRTKFLCLNRMNLTLQGHIRKLLD